MTNTWLVGFAEILAGIVPCRRGGRTDKAGLLAVVKSGQLKMTSIKLSDMHVYLYGHFAVVTGAVTQAGTLGEPAAPKIVFTDCFFTQNGTWQAMASQRTTASAK